MYEQKEREMTLSPSEGTSPAPTRRSNALTPPEFGSSKKSDMADFEEEDGGSDKINVQQHAAEVKERENALLVVDDDDELEEEGVGVAARMMLDWDLDGTKPTVRWGGTCKHCTEAIHWIIVFCSVWADDFIIIFPSFLFSFFFGKWRRISTSTSENEGHTVPKRLVIKNCLAWFILFYFEKVDKLAI